MKSLIVHAGSYRKNQMDVFDCGKAIFIGSPGLSVPALIHKIYNYSNHDKVYIIINSCVFHDVFEFIHPFSDCNCLIGRLFQT